MDPKSSPHSGSQKVRFCCYLLHLSKVRRLRNGPHFGSCLKTSLHKIQKTEETEEAQQLVQKKRSPSANLTVYLKIRRLPDSPPSRTRFSNKKQQFEQQQQQQQQQLQQLWLDVDFCFQNCPFGDETCKKKMLLIVGVQGSVI